MAELPVQFAFAPGFHPADGPVREMNQGILRYSESIAVEMNVLYAVTRLQRERFTRRNWNRAEGLKKILKGMRQGPDGIIFKIAEVAEIGAEPVLMPTVVADALEGILGPVPHDAQIPVGVGVPAIPAE